VSVRVAVFASGGGSNLQALLDRFADGDPARIVLVVSDRAAAGALERARTAGIAAVHVPVRGREDADVARETLHVLQQHDVELVLLAGYLRLVPAAVIAAFRGRMLNVHPALLPAFGGAGMYGRHVHEAVLAAGCRVTGATVHEVTEHFDEGRILAQWPVPVLPGDDAAAIAARVLRIEHVLYPAVVAAHARVLRGVGTNAAEPGDVFRLATSRESMDSEIASLAALQDG